MVQPASHSHAIASRSIAFALGPALLGLATSCDDSEWDPPDDQNVGLSDPSNQALACPPVTPPDDDLTPYENPQDERPFFSFFLTSQAGMYSLPAGELSPAPDPALGYGGNFGGIAGADEVCTLLARRSNTGDTKTWRAFLSASALGESPPVNAIERIGSGPWYDYNGRLLALNLDGLLSNGEGRPSGADPQLREMFTDENGEDARPPGQDNHDTLTGSGRCGRLHNDGAQGAIASCEAWTSSTVRGLETDLAGVGGQIPVGHSWPRDLGFSLGDASIGGHWISDHTINGCEPGYDIDGGFGAALGDFRVGAGGGYGGIYCFALGASDP